MFLGYIHTLFTVEQTGLRCQNHSKCQIFPVWIVGCSLLSNFVVVGWISDFYSWRVENRIFPPFSCMHPVVGILDRELCGCASHVLCIFLLVIKVYGVWSSIKAFYCSLLCTWEKTEWGKPVLYRRISPAEAKIWLIRNTPQGCTHNSPTWTWVRIYS